MIIRSCIRQYGGTKPILYRSAFPQYDKLRGYDNNATCVGYTLQDYNDITFSGLFPNIVPLNYEGRWYHLYSDPSSQHVRACGFANEVAYTYLLLGGKHSSMGPHWNKYYGLKPEEHNECARYVGNYFAAFTNNGGYIKSGKTDVLDPTKNVQRVPSFASVSPLDSETPKNRRKSLTNQNIIENLSRVHTKNTQHLVGDKERVTLPYLRALTIDRRFDFELYILGPAIGANNVVINSDNNVTWKGARVMGFFFNGIDMSYDEDYNILSSANSDTTLEYTISAETDTDTSLTVIKNDVITWNGDTPKNYYEFWLDNYDLNTMVEGGNKSPLWPSDYSGDFLSGTSEVHNVPAVGSNFYLYANGAFSMDGRAKNYPTVRTIDQGNLFFNSTSVIFSQVNCSYNIDVQTSDDMPTAIVNARGRC